MPFSVEVAKDTCKLGSGEECCKYLLLGPDGFECAKTDEKMKLTIDLRDNMVAKGDCCEGVENV